MDVRLSKDAAKLLYLLYQSYLAKRSGGKTKREARYFCSSHYVHEYLAPDWQFDDVDDTCRELSRAQILQVFWADNIANDIQLTDLGITTMENIIPDKLKDISSAVDLIINAFSLIPTSKS